MAWKLVFRGALADGVTPEQAAAALAEHFGQQAGAVEQRLFAGGAVRVKVVESEQDARRFAARFREAGVELDIEPMAADSTPASASRARNGRSRVTVKLALAGAAAVFSAAVAAGAWYAWPVLRGGATSPEQAVAAQALATANLIALGHLDVERAMQLQRRFAGAPDPEALLTGEDGLWQSLLRAGLDPAERIDDVLAGVYAHDGHGAWAAVVLGRVPREPLREWLGARFDVERFDAATSTVYFSWLDEATCEPVPLHAARVGESSVLLGRADLVDRLGRRLEAASPAAVAVDDWLVRTERHVLSIGIFNPARVGQAADGIAGMMLAQAGQAAEPAEAVYLGAVPALMPPGIVLSGTIASDDAAFLSRTHEAASGWLASAEAAAGETDPALVDLYDRIDVALGERDVSALVRLDTDLDDELGRLVDATLGRAFGISAGGSAVASVEQVDENPMRFADASAAELEAYDSFGSSFFEPQWRDGPFAAAVSRLHGADDGRARITMQVEGRGLPNLGPRTDLVRLRVLDVTNADGGSLLPARECGPARNRDWTSNTLVSEGNSFKGTEIVSFPKVTLDKTLALADGARAADVAAIRGEIEYRLPSEVRSVRLEAPLAGRIVETDDLRVRFEPAPEGTLKYQASGETARLLAVRALNSQSRVLETGGSTSGRNWLGAGEHASISIRGNIAAAEVVVAEALEPLRYELELPGGYPPIGAEAPLVPPAPALARPAALTRALRLEPPAVPFPHFEPMATTTTGPALVVVRDVQAAPFVGLLTRIEVYVPRATSLARQLNGASLVLDRVELADGAALDIGAGALVTLDDDGAHWLNGEYRTDDDKPWLAGSAQLQASEYAEDIPASLYGRVILRAVEQEREVSMSALPGSGWQGAGIEIAVVEWHQSSLSLAISAGGERILSAVALDAAGAVVGRADQILSGPRGGHSATMSLAAVPETLRIAYAAEPAEHELPFSVELPR